MATVDTYEVSRLRPRPRQAFNPKGSAPAWALTRSDLTETLTYFRCTQGGIYYADGVIQGLLLENYGGSRSHLDAEVVITRLYGSDGEKTDKTTIKKFESMVRKTHDEHHAVVLILGRSNSQTDIDFTGHAAYCTMSVYWLTDYWFEKFGHTEYCQVRFEKADLESPSWFTPERPAPPSLTDRALNSEPVFQTCPVCQRLSVRRYSQAFLCGYRECNNFSQTPEDVSWKDLAYTETYLTQRIQPRPLPNVELAPQRFSSSLENRELWRGSVCPTCGKCVSRFHWSRWICDGCRHVEAVLPNIPSKAELLDEEPKQWKGKGKPTCINDEEFIVGRDLELRNNKRYNLHQYQLPNGIGNIFLLDPIVTGPDTTDMIDELWKKVVASANSGEIPLSRSLMKKSGISGLKTRNFLANYGEHYHGLVADVETTTFEQAPYIIRELQNVAAGAEKLALGFNTVVEGFNELLLVGYWTDQEMKRHTDGEYEVGSPITTLSLGSKAHMDWYYSMSSYRHQEKRQGGWVKKDGCPLPGMLNYDAFVALREENLEPEVFERRYKDLVEQNGKKLGQRSEPPAYLTANLVHGSLVIMVGTEISNYFEHAVEPLGSLRVAATFRRLDNSRVKTKEVVSRTEKKKRGPAEDDKDTGQQKKPKMRRNKKEI